MRLVGIGGIRLPRDIGRSRVFLGFLVLLFSESSFQFFSIWFRLDGEVLSLSTATKKVPKENAAPISRAHKKHGHALVTPDG